MKHRIAIEMRYKGQQILDVQRARIDQVTHELSERLCVTLVDQNAQNGHDESIGTMWVRAQHIQQHRAVRADGPCDGRDVLLHGGLYRRGKKRVYTHDLGKEARLLDAQDKRQLNQPEHVLLVQA